MRNTEWCDVNHCPVFVSQHTTQKYAKNRGMGIRKQRTEDRGQSFVV